MQLTTPFSVREKLFRVFVVTALLSLGGAGTIYARGIPWHEAGGPYGGPVNSLLLFGGGLFAGTAGNGVFFSTNQVATWTSASAGLSNPYVIALAGSGTALLAATRGGISLSTDFGASWTAANTGLTSTYVNALAINSAGGALKFFAGTNGGAFLSADTGKSWTKVNGTIPDTLKNSPVYTLAFDTSGNLFAGLYGWGLYRSSDDGTHWTQQTGFPGSYVYSLAVKSDTLLAGTTTIFNTSGVYISTNSGNSWSLYHTGLPHIIPYALSFGDTNVFVGTDRGVYRTGGLNTTWGQVNFGLTGDTLIHALAFFDGDMFAAAGIGGVYVSVNNASWTQVNTGLYTHVQALTNFGSHLYAGTAEAGVFFSIYGGTSWIQENSGLTNTDVVSLASAYNTVYAGTLIGAFWGLNGKNWSPGGSDSLNSNVHALAAGPAPGVNNGLHLYAGTGSGVFRSTDFGSTWHLRQNGYVRAFALKDSMVYAGTAGNGIFRSTDWGTNWTQTSVTSGNVYALAVVDTNLIAAFDNGGVSRSPDKGDLWGPVYNNPADPVRTFTVAGSILFAGTGGGHVFFSTDEGTTWTNIGSGLPAVEVSSLVVNGGDIYAGTYNASVWTISLVGIGPAAASVTLPVAAPAQLPRPAQVALDTVYNFNLPGDETTVSINFSAIGGFGTVTVERYQSGPANPAFTGTPPGNISQYRWNVLQSGLSSWAAEVRFDLTRFAGGISHPASVTIYSRPTSGTGVFSPLPTTYDSASNQLRATVNSFSEFIFGSDDNLLTDVPPDGNLPGSFLLEQNYPNPFNPVTDIKFVVRQENVREDNILSYTTLRVYDILGRVVATLVDGIQEAGEHSVRWDASNVASGIYFYRLETKNFSATKKLLLIR